MNACIHDVDRAAIVAVGTSRLPSNATKRALRIMVDFIIIGLLGQNLYKKAREGTTQNQEDKKSITYVIQLKVFALVLVSERSLTMLCTRI